MGDQPPRLPAQYSHLEEDIQRFTQTGTASPGLQQALAASPEVRAVIDHAYESIVMQLLNAPAVAGSPDVVQLAFQEMEAMPPEERRTRLQAAAKGVSQEVLNDVKSLGRSG
jgi:hypothetical protein